MNILYSATTGGFYDTSINKTGIPPDAVEITDYEHKYLLDGEAAGKRIVADSKGFPVLADQPQLSIANIAKHQRKMIEDARKADEATGVTVNAIRYAGDPGNRAALREAIDFADASGLTTFTSWKDSDDKFHPNHPVDDVRQALNDISARRSQLIAREGELVAQIDEAEILEDREAIEAVEWSFSG